MFTKDEILDESVDLSYIQEAEGYDDFDAVTRIIAENYENEMVARDYMDKCDRKERQMIAEGASEEEIASFQETSVGSVFQYIKGVMERFWAKIKAFFTKMIQKVKTFFAKRVMDKIKKNKALIERLFKSPEYKKMSDDEVMMSYRFFNAEKITADFSKINISKLNTLTEENSDAMFKDVMTLVFGTSLSNGLTRENFKSKFHDFVFNNNTDNKIDVIWNNDFEAVKKAFSSLQKNLDSIKKYVSKTITGIKKFDYSSDAADLKDMNRRISFINSVASTVSSAVFREVIFAVNQFATVVNKAIRLVSKAGKMSKPENDSADKKSFADDLNLY